MIFGAAFLFLCLNGDDCIMKLLFKTLAAGAVLTFAVFGTAFAEGGLSFENKVSTDTWCIGNYSGEQRFPGITEAMKLEYLGDKVDAKAEVSFWLYRYNDDIEKNSQMAFYGFDFGDTYVKFRPIDLLQIAIRGNEKAAGSYFPVMDKNLRHGNYTGDFGLLFKPLKGLSVGTGIDFRDGYGFIYNDFSTSYDRIYLNLGAEYEFENIGAFALTFNDVINNFSLGVYAKISAISDFDIYAGFSYQHIASDFLCIPAYVLNDAYLRGNTLLNAGMEFRGIDKLTLAADLATNLFINGNAYFDGHYHPSYDLYAGLKVSYDINDSFNINCNASMAFDFTDSGNDDYNNYCGSPVISIYPELSYKIGNHTFKAGFKMELDHTYEVVKSTQREALFGACLPVSWTYSF